jgi:RNA polymerase sigma-54 factor
MLPEVAQGNIQRICRRIHVGERVAQEMIQALKSMRPYPTWGTGLRISTGLAEVPVLAPDFVFERGRDGTYALRVLEPSIRLDSLSMGTAEEARLDEEWSRRLGRLREEAEGLLELSLRRTSVILQVLARILDLQKDWLLELREYLEPLSVSEIARSLGVSPSTVSRALKDRYLVCPRGTYALRELLSRHFDGDGEGGKSRDFIAREIVNLEQTHAGEPLTDKRIAELLRDKGIEVARRTVNKYRKQLRGF